MGMQLQQTHKSNDLGQVIMSDEGPATVEDALNFITDVRVELLNVGLRDLVYSGGTSFKNGGRRWQFSDDAWRTVCSYLSIPPDLLPQISWGAGGILIKVIHGAGRKANGAPDHLRLAADGNGMVVGVADADLACLSNEEIVNAITETVPERISSETLSVADLRLDETEFELFFHTEGLVTEPRPGDVLHGGLMVRHSQVGLSPTVILSYVHRLVCSNGMTQRVFLQGRPSRTKRCKVENSPKRMVETVRRQLREAWTQLEERLEGFKGLLAHPLEMDELPEALRRRWSINRKVAAEIALALQNDELGRTGTEYDLVNALSRVATHSEELLPRYRRHLSLVAGMFAQRHVHQCRFCGSWLDKPVKGTA